MIVILVELRVKLQKMKITKHKQAIFSFQKPEKFRFFILIVQFINIVPFKKMYAFILVKISTLNVAVEVYNLTFPKCFSYAYK